MGKLEPVGKSGVLMGEFEGKPNEFEGERLVKSSILITLTHEQGKRVLAREDNLVLVLAAWVLIAGIFFGEWALGRIGLTLDITGFLLLCSDLKPGGKIVQTEWDVIYDEAERRRYILAKYIGHLAVVLVVFGFVLQFLGTSNGC